jgi:Ca-activated chloride channel family protein
VYDNGRPQPIAIFSSEDTPVTIGLLIDTSSSMRAKLGEVVAASVAFARSSNPQDELFVLEFNESVRDALPDRRFLLAADVDNLQAAVESLRPEGRTALYDGLLAALDRLDTGKLGRKALVVISDGGDNVSRATLADVEARAHRSSAVIFTIGLFDDDDPDRNPGVLGSIARTTGGERFLPRSAGPLLQACQRIARAIRNGYTMAIEPPERDGAYHRVRVQVSGPDRERLSVRTRDGYVASRAGNGDTP